ncbi:MAG: enoyl-CoA hydratase/isomerase family protein [Acidimicrobiia bacterium]
MTSAWAAGVRPRLFSREQPRLQSLEGIRQAVKIARVTRRGHVDVDGGGDRKIVDQGGDPTDDDVADPGGVEGADHASAVEFRLVCCSDVVILHESARFGIPEPKLGFIPSQIIPFLVRRLGEGYARDLAVTGRVISAAEAYRLGLGHHLCHTDEEIETVLAGLLDQIGRMEPGALAAVKRLVLSCATKDD